MPRRKGLRKNIRALLVFQLKLGLDALRDLLLSPLAFVLFFLDLLLTPMDKPGYFHRLMRFGRRTDEWISLFDSHHDDAEALEQERAEKGKPENVDTVIDTLLKGKD